MSNKIIHSEHAPKAIGPYSQAIAVNGLVFCAGQIPLDPVTMNVVPGGITEQTHQCLKNAQAVLQAAGSDLSKVVKTTVFMQDLGDFAAMNAVYATYFPNNPPARSTIQVAKLPKDSLVEVECIGAI